MTASAPTLTLQEPQRRRGHGATEQLGDTTAGSSLTGEAKQTPRSRKHWVPTENNPKRTTPRHLGIKSAKVRDKERILKAPTEKQQAINKGTPIQLSADFSAKPLQDGRGMIHSQR